jgi:MFS family permease
VATHTISLLVNNRPGVLARVSELFGRFGCNIEKLSVGTGKEPAIARMKIEISIDAGMLDQVVGRLSTLLDVIQVKTAARRRRIADLSRTAAFWLVAYGLFITLFGTNVPSPLYALYRLKWTLTPPVMTLIFAAYAIVVIPTILLSGQLSDRVGRIRVLLVGMIFTFIGSVCFLFADGPGLLMISRMLQGVSVGILNGVAVAALTELAYSHKKAQAALVAAAAVTVGNALGPVVSGFLGELAPYPTQLPYAIHVLLVIPCLFGLLFIREPAGRALAKGRLHFPSVPRPLRFLLALTSLTSFIVWSIMSLVLSVIPTYIPLIIGKLNLIVSGVVIATVLGFSAWSQLISRKLPLAASLMIGYLLLVTGLIGLIGAISAKSLWLLLLSSVLIGLGHGPCYARSLQYLNEASSDETRAEAVSIYYAVTYMGVALPVIGLGFGIQHFGLLSSMQWFTVMIIIVIAVSSYMWKKHLRCLTPRFKR